jgi:cytochrome c oxidase subunit 2
MSAWQAFAVFALLGLAWTVIWASLTVRSGGPVLPYEDVSRRAARLRRLLAVLIIPILAVALLISMTRYPYPGFASRRLGPPALTVQVVARQWEWELSTRTLPRGQVVEFAVTAADVNHGFGIYGPSGGLLAQVQAMPRYVNRLITTFSQPGTYTVRCLEYCGIPHHGMATTFEVR